MNIFWMIVAVVGFVTEGITQRFIAVWFSVGALAALLMEVLDIHPATQFFVFFSVGSLLFYATRPMVLEYLTMKKQNSADEHGLPGTTCQVVEPIDSVAGTGVIEHGGRNWEARAECTARYEAGTQVRVARVAKGVAYVEEIPPEEPVDEEPADEMAEETIPDPESEEGAVFEFSSEP